MGREQTVRFLNQNGAIRTFGRRNLKAVIANIAMLQMYPGRFCKSSFVHVSQCDGMSNNIAITRFDGGADYSLLSASIGDSRDALIAG